MNFEDQEKDLKMFFLNLFRDFIGAGIGLLFVIVSVLIFNILFSITSVTLVVVILILGFMIAIRTTMSLRRNSFVDDLYDDYHSKLMAEKYIDDIKKADQNEE